MAEIEQLFKRGDVVLHPKRPEWGDGVIDQTTTIKHQGKTAQRVVVKFKNHGRVAINTAIAPLQAKGVNVAKPKPGPKPFNTRPALDLSKVRNDKAAEAKKPASAATREATTEADANDDSGWLASLEGKRGSDRLTALPHTLSDPFSSYEERLNATVDLYRFSRDARSIIDWAIAQTRLEDPLSTYTRQELEQAFPRFARDRDSYLFELCMEIKKAGKLQVIKDVLNKARHANAKQVLRQAIRA